MAANATSSDAATGGGATDCVVRADPWVHQLAGAQRGALHGSHDAIGSKVFAQAWGLDATGNWSTFDEDPDGDGDWDLQQPRTANPDGLDLYEHVFLTGQQVIETRQTASSAAEPETLPPKYQHVWSRRYIDALILRDENTDADALCDDFRLYYLADANFNVTALVDTTGSVAERYLYAPYGQLTVLDPTFAEDADGLSDVSNVTLYTGREQDAATGLYYYRARYDDSALGVFVGRDPIGYQSGDANCYRYVHGTPSKFTDPTGHQPGIAAALPVPPPTPGKGTNATRPFGMGYTFTGCCSSKNTRLSPIPGVGTPPKAPIPGTGPSGGAYEIFPFPTTPPAAVGGGGALPCHILVVKCPGFVAVFHFQVVLHHREHLACSGGRQAVVPSSAVVMIPASQTVLATMRSLLCSG